MGVLVAFGGDSVRKVWTKIYLIMRVLFFFSFFFFFFYTARRVLT